MTSFYETLKSEFSKSPETWLEKIGFHISGNGNGIIKADHPGCKEADGKEADFCYIWSHTGNLVCHRCGAKTTDITDTFRSIKGIDGDHAMSKASHELAKLMGVPIPEFKPKATHLPKQVTDKVISIAKKRLLSEEGAKAREFIEKEWKCDPVAVAELGIGSWSDEGKETIIIPMGNRGRYKKIEPVKGGKKRWDSNKSIQAPKFWCAYSDPSGFKEFMVLEGESDTIAAACRVKWGELGIGLISLVHGRSTNLSQEDFPKELVGKKVTVIQDIDAFQGPLGSAQGTDRQKKDAETHTLGPLKRLCEKLRERNCDVYLATIAGEFIDPVLQPKGDLRDWMDAGGRTPDQLKTFSYDDIYKEVDSAKEVHSVQEVLRSDQHQLISVIGFVDSVETDPVVIPMETMTQCEYMEEGMEKTCAKCGLPSRLGPYKQNTVDWNNFLYERAGMLLAKNQEKEIEKRVCQKASGCSRLQIRTTKAVEGWVWRMRSQDSGETSTVPVISTGGLPPVVGRVRVTGRRYPVGNKLYLIADRLEEMDSIVFEVDSGDLTRLLPIMPHSTNDLNLLKKCVNEIADNVGDHITKVYGRRDLHIGALLNMCSTLKYTNSKGKETRGWMDCLVIGEPREGKSSLYRELFSALGMGYFVGGTKSTLSVPGLIASSHTKNTVTPGIWPKHHGKAIALDEIHQIMGDDRIFFALQTPRSDGEVDSNKCSGGRQFPGAVRATFIGNFPEGTTEFTEPCHVVCQIFNNQPPHISRVDYALFVRDHFPHASYKVTSQLKYPASLLKTLVSRAWSQTPSDVSIHPECFDICAGYTKKWMEIYDQKICPLVAGDEKGESMLRIAIAVANLTFSHTGSDGSYRAVEVRPVHVHFAAEWLEHTWREARYDVWSEALLRQHEVLDPINVCHVLVGGLKPSQVEPNLGPLFHESIDPREVMGYMRGDTFQEQMSMLNFLKSHRVIHRIKVLGKAKIRATKGGQMILQNLMDMAVKNEDAFQRAQEDWARWMQCVNPSGPPPVNLADQNEFELFMHDDSNWR